MDIELASNKTFNTKIKVDENETQSIQCPLNIENDKHKRGSESKIYVHQYTNYYLE